MTKCLRFHETGPAHEVLRLEQEEVGQPGQGELRVRMLAAPINPADLNFVDGKYGLKPELPSRVGFEGAGEVDAVGSACQNWNAGDRVLLPGGPGAWCEVRIAPAAGCVKIPKEVPVAQAAMLRINPPTAWAMLTHFVQLGEGDWVVQNASNSGVGRSVIAIARKRGWKTANLVRRAELIGPLKAAGADVVVVDDADAAEALKSAMGGARARLALNAVGGESALRLLNLLEDHGPLVTYGAMGRQPLRVPNGPLIFRDLQIRGFWVSKWLPAAPAEVVEGMFRELSDLCINGTLSVPVEKEYPLEAFAEATQHASQGAREGKILFRMNH